MDVSGKGVLACEAFAGNPSVVCLWGSQNKMDCCRVGVCFSIGSMLLLGIPFLARDLAADKLTVGQATEREGQNASAAVGVTSAVVGFVSVLVAAVGWLIE